MRRTLLLQKAYVGSLISIIILTKLLNCLRPREIMSIGYVRALTMTRHIALIPPRPTPRRPQSTILFASTATAASTTTHYFTCRHNYESTLIKELTLERPINNIGSVWTSTEKLKPKNGETPKLIHISSPCPGLVKAEYNTTCDREYFLEDPVYALQTLPNAIELHGKSINELAKKAVSALSLDKIVANGSTRNDAIVEELLASSRGSLTLHAIVPDMLKGNPKPKMQRRVINIAKDIGKILQTIYPCARKYTAIQDSNNDRAESISTRMEWILQLLLISPEEIVVSLSPIKHCILHNNEDLRISMSWPCASLSAGLADAEEDTIHHSMKGKQVGKSSLGPAPSSAYRKLIEALSCMGVENVPNGSMAVDLGASPGGWTSVLRKIGFKVMAVDRAALHKELMNDEGVTFIAGDAFGFTPPSHINPVVLMASDIIAFPERIVDLLEKWCSLKLATAMIVTMKFKGETPAWDELRKANEAATRNGYVFRAKHFFNNKNEVTLMLAAASAIDRTGSLAHFPSWKRLDCVSSFQPKSMYEVTLPQQGFFS